MRRRVATRTCLGWTESDMAEQVLFDLEGWPGGFNRSVADSALLKEELLDAVNVVVDERGDVASRPGFTDAVDAGTVVQLMHWQLR